MMMILRKFQSGPFAERARRSAHGIVLAVVLTLAAIIFVISAVQRSSPETASITAPAAPAPSAVSSSN